MGEVTEIREQKHAVKMSKGAHRPLAANTKAGVV